MICTSVLSVRTPERVSKAKSSITEEDIRAWYASLKSEMEKLILLMCLKNLPEYVILINPAFNYILKQVRSSV